MKDIHIGNIIRQQVKMQGISVTELARLLQIQRPNLYRILRNKHINTALLCRICEMLHYDFFALYSQALQPETEEK